MTRQSVGRLVSFRPAARGRGGRERCAAEGSLQEAGRELEWDANDTGPNQCTPVAKGRFKKDGDACRWDANDVGANQCRPASGRWKKDGDACTWSASDSGPNQCNPRQAR